MNDASSRLAELPAVHEALRHPDIQHLVLEHGRELVTNWIRDGLATLRRAILAGELAETRASLLAELAERIRSQSVAVEQYRLLRVINATGVILHTGLGRAPLSQPAIQAMQEAAQATPVEVDLLSGERRTRGFQLEHAWRRLTHAEASLVVNNNAAATLLALQGLCAGREVILSRGQLIEIGGSFRLPEIFALSGARLREVGTTNRTRLEDYARAIGPETAAILHVHPSNYRIVGFTEAPDIAELSQLAHIHRLLAIDDIGSGALLDMQRFGLPPEPTFAASLAAGADLVLGSGDKLLGGPQCGILLGRRTFIDQLHRHPLTRVVRIDKLTLAALAATLSLYEQGLALEQLPILQLLSASLDSLAERAATILHNLGAVQHLDLRIERSLAPVGGGSLPLAELPTMVISLRHQSCSTEALARFFRTGSISIIGRIHRDRLLFDLRSVQSQDDSRLELALRLADRPYIAT